MTNTIDTNNFADMASLLGMSEGEFGALSEQSKKTSSTYTRTTYYPEQRNLMSGWTKSLELGISLPGEPKESEFPQLSRAEKIVGFEGVIVLSEQQAVQQQFVNGKPKIPLCSTVGYYDRTKAKTDPEAYVKGLPSFIPWGGLSAWDNAARKFIAQPNAVVKDNDMLGSKGMRCADCVACGGDKVAVDSKTTVYCRVNCQIIVYVTHVKLRKGKTEKWLPIQKLNPDLPPGILVTMGLNKSAYKGVNLRDDKRLSGYMGLLAELAKLSGTLSCPYIHTTRIELITQEVTNPSTGNKEQQGALHFTSQGLAEREAIKAARDAWNSENPNHGAEKEFLDISDYQNSEVTTYVAEEEDDDYSYLAEQPKTAAPSAEAAIAEATGEEDPFSLDDDPVEEDEDDDLFA